MGHDFLRHIERTRLLLHLIDLTASDPIADYQTIQAELKAYGHSLAARQQIIGLNKLDAVDKETYTLIAEEVSQLTAAPIFGVSAVAGIGLDALLQKIWQTLDDLPDTQ